MEMQNTFELAHPVQVPTRKIFRLSLNDVDLLYHNETPEQIKLIIVLNTGGGISFLLLAVQEENFLDFRSFDLES